MVQMIASHLRLKHILLTLGPFRKKHEKSRILHRRVNDSQSIIYDKWGMIKTTQVL
jgi:hypothetical protein